jgi:mono/diheme cytochrome c family protein
MITRHLILASLVVAAPALANPFHGARIEAGEEIHADQCVACHAGKFGGKDGSDIYTRSNRRVTSPDALRQQLTACTTMLNLGLFPEDENDIAAYLNMHYYKFE